MLVEAIEALHVRLRQYIEATYHISDPGLLAQRAQLLEEAGVLRQSPFLESTRSYMKDRRFASVLQRLSEQEQAVLGDLVARLSQREAPLLFDPPYEHQLEALEAVLVDRKNTVVFTGTGSGKTECFTIPILMRLAREAVSAPASFRVHAVRAIILYPMNALVNDQLSRIRLLLGDDAVASVFKAHGGRPAQFGQYTGRTPFARPRDFKAEGDGQRMAAFRAFYMDTVLKPMLAGDQGARLLWDALRVRGRWPAKPNLPEWFGGSEYGSEKRLWEDRLHTQQEDRELLARHEFYGYRVPGRADRLGAPPDVLITNYSMLEYMLMRPLERNIFDETREWLDANREQPLLLVLDEAHLYRGAQGTEVALLVRRLFERLGLSGEERAAQAQVIVTSASFSSAVRATEFAAQLVGRPAATFAPIGGRLAIIDGGASANRALTEAFSQVDLSRFYEARNSQERAEIITPVLRALGIDPALPFEEPLALERALYDGLEFLPVRRALVQRTQREACKVEELAADLFPEAANEKEARLSTEALVALCAFARRTEGGSNLLPSRFHSFHRGLPGLWVCLDPQCVGQPVQRRGGVAGTLFAQPRDRCKHCDSRVLQYFTCRSCGASYGRAFAADVQSPDFIWSDGGGLPGESGSGDEQLRPVDILLDVGRAKGELTEIVDLEIRTGLFLRSVPRDGARVRPVGLYRLEVRQGEDPQKEGRLFFRCGACGDDNDKSISGGERRKVLRRSPVEDHQTSGQDPFYALVHEQLMQQPARAQKPAFLERETPLRGRKVLVFSDGRQKAARLAAELGRSALRDSARAILIRGFQVLQEQRHVRPLSSTYAALLLGAVDLGVQLRATDERFDGVVARDLGQAHEVRDADFDQDLLSELEARRPPVPIATILLRLLRDKHTGLQALALGRIVPAKTAKSRVETALAGLSLGTLDLAARRAFVELWLGRFLELKGCDLFKEDELEFSARWLAGEPTKGSFKAFEPLLKAIGGAGAVTSFRRDWLPPLREIFCEGNEEGGVLRSQRIAIALPTELGDLQGWVRCARCSRVQSVELPVAVCTHCGTPDELHKLSSEPARGLFLARKGFYRSPALGVAAAATTSHPLVVREHSAQLTGDSGDAHNRAERYELAFQDITTPSVDGMRSPVDVLSCTTTMEVGIDIGNLSGVALRNMPPGRANYQQRAGRAGRRGSGVATVLAYADQDGHNQHLYENPEKLIKAPVPDPLLNLTNRWIARRHINAFVLQRYLAERITPADEPLEGEVPTERKASLFASLGTVRDFVAGTQIINLADLEQWLREPSHRRSLRDALERWLPQEVVGRSELLQDFDAQLLGALRHVLAADITAYVEAPPADAAVVGVEDVDAEEEDPGAKEQLLERLLYVGLLPKYAFPTDLVAMHVFEATRGLESGAGARDKLRYAPQRNLAIALSEYAPGKTVFIDGRAWLSGAIYSPFTGALEHAFAPGRLKYLRSCKVCGHSQLFGSPQEGAGSPCPSCAESSLGEGEGQSWLRPPGFAHPVTRSPSSEPDLSPVGRAGRAILTAPSPSTSEWSAVPGKVGLLTHLGRADDRELLVTNQGPRNLGFRICKTCGAAEPATESRLVSHDGHSRPAPSPRGRVEQCERPEYETVHLGTSFRTDVLLLRLMLPEGQQLSPRDPAYKIALTSLTEALAAATCITLEIEAGEVLGGFRLGFTREGPVASALEVFLYDQLAGGAGYVVEAHQRIDEILVTTKALLEHKPHGGRRPAPACDRACYSCLLSFKNSHEHALYDRWLALDLLDAAITGAPAIIAPDRQQAAYSTIAEWLSLMTNAAVLRNQRVADDPAAPSAPVSVRRADGRLIIPALSHPFSPMTPMQGEFAELLESGAGLNLEVVPLNFLEVTRALPRPMEMLKERLHE